MKHEQLNENIRRPPTSYLRDIIGPSQFINDD